MIMLIFILIWIFKNVHMKTIYINNSFFKLFKIILCACVNTPTSWASNKWPRIFIRSKKPVKTSCLIWRTEQSSWEYGGLTQSWHLFECWDTLIREIQLWILDLAGLIEHLLCLWHLSGWNTRHWCLIHCARNCTHTSVSFK